jgi:hypothetical protein
MNALEHVRNRLQEISATATLAAETLGAGAVDWMPAELDRFAWQLARLATRLGDVCERLAVGVDPQGEGAVRRYLQRAPSTVE